MDVNSQFCKRHWSTETGQLSRRRKNQSEVFWKVVQRIRGYIVVKRTKRLVFDSILFLRISSAIVLFRIWDLLESCPCKTPLILTIPSYPVGAGIAQCWKHDTALRCFSLGALVMVLPLDLDWPDWSLDSPTTSQARSRWQSTSFKQSSENWQSQMNEVNWENMFIVTGVSWPLIPSLLFFTDSEKNGINPCSIYGWNKDDIAELGWPHEEVWKSWSSTCTFNSIFGKYCFLKCFNYQVIINCSITEIMVMFPIISNCSPKWRCVLVDIFSEPRIVVLVYSTENSEMI